MRKSILMAGVVSMLALATTIPAFAEVGWKQSENGANTGKWYYNLNESGSEYYKDGWQVIDGKHYYFDAEGFLVTDTTVTTNGVSYTVNHDGQWVVDGVVQTVENTAATTTATTTSSSTTSTTQAQREAARKKLHASKKVSSSVKNSGSTTTSGPVAGSTSEDDFYSWQNSTNSYDAAESAKETDD